MRRAVAVLLLLAAVPIAAIAAKPVGVVDAIGMIDYRSGHHFKVGDWATYLIKGGNITGYKTDYTVTVVIAGEERWWGEECFWYETRTTYPGQDPEITASLLSYGVFEDSMPARHFARYLRKYFDGLDGKGQPAQQLFLRNPVEYISRGYDYWEPARKTDSLGVETVEVPKGAFQAFRTKQDFRGGVTQSEGDSSIYLELTEKRSHWWSNRIPITSLVRMDEELTEQRRAWRLGEPSNHPLQISQHSEATTQLIDFGHGMRSTLVDQRLQRPLAEQEASPAKRRPAPPASRTTKTRG